MNIYFSDSSFRVGGVSYPNFPILVDACGRVVEVVLLFFKQIFLNRGGARDPKTWEKYGRCLYDYFGFLEANPRLQWDLIPGEMSGDISPLAHYITWCEVAVGNAPGYINDKLGVIQRFYRWAQKNQLVEHLPFTDIQMVSSHTGGMLSYMSGHAAYQATTDMHRKEPKSPIKVLSRNQIDILMKGTLNPTHKSTLHLALNAGLRAEELTSFPAKYVVDCRRISNNVRTLGVRLDPKEMHTKNDKARRVQISVPCMNRLWQYRETVRPKLQAESGLNSDELFLTRFGVPFVPDGLVAPFGRLGKRNGFHVHPHMLRHTFATHTLAALEELKRQGRVRTAPVLILKNLLGHASITTTMDYVHHLESIDDAQGTQYQAEIDAAAAGYLREMEK